ncbi:AAA family ATPase [Sorangium sp. So ce429]
MRLTHAQVRLFKSINDSGAVPIDKSVTVLVGQNEAGKTAFLQALYKARPADNGAKFDREMDYPRSALNDYEETHGDEPAKVVTLTYELGPEEVRSINDDLGVEALTQPTFTVTHSYDNSSNVGLRVNEQAFAMQLIDNSGLPADAAAPLRAAKSARDLMSILAAATRGPEAETFYQQLQARFGKMPQGWSGADHEIWTKHLIPAIPRFIYFDDYRLLPGRMNLTGLQQRLAQSASNPAALAPQDRAVLGLLRMAKVDLDQLLSASTYEAITAKLEAFSNKVTDRVFRYWQQNDQLEVRIDVRQTPGELAPFNNGPNLEIRIYNKRHRVTVSFDQRSRGFIWFFSFLVWFDSVKVQLGTKADIVLLLDEPGLNLHALAQYDFLRYIDDLSKSHQTLYTTHSPFMVHSDRLHQVRLVEDRKDLGTMITEDVSSSDPRTIFPLQAALGYTIAQNLFISKRNLLVEGPADLLYLQQASSVLDKFGRMGLRGDVTIVPTGGLDNVATFIALLGGSRLELVVLHDFDNRPHQRIEQLQRDKIIREKFVLSYGMFRVLDDTGNGIRAKGKKGAGAGKPTAVAAAVSPSPAEVDEEIGSLPRTDIEDLFTPATYIDLFNRAFAKQLGDRKVRVVELPPGERIVERVNRHLKDNEIELRSNGGFNHYAVANCAAINPTQDWDKGTLDRFEALFREVNGLFTNTGD